MSHDCCVALPHDATGLSAFYDCGISLSGSLTFFLLNRTTYTSPDLAIPFSLQQVHIRLVQIRIKLTTID